MRKVIQTLIVVGIMLSCGGIFSVFHKKVLDAAARAQCTNNCRVIGISLNNYRDTWHDFPPAAITNPDLSAEKRLSWIVTLVPYVEANNLYSRMDKEKSWDAETNRFATEMSLQYLQCSGYPGQPPTKLLGQTNYVGISGIGEDGIALPRENVRAGILGYDRPVNPEELKRGASETLFVVETCQVSGTWTAAGPSTTRGLIPNGSTYIGKEGQFGGNHPGGANVTFADGSVRFIEQSIDPAVWEAMATLSGKGNQE